MQTSKCPCGSGKDLAQCCGLYLQGRALPETAMALMRSRYSAYVLQEIDYLKETLWPKFQPAFDFEGTARWASENHWVGLTVIQFQNGGRDDRAGTVLFEANYLSGGQMHKHRELSKFRKKAGRWYYVEAIAET
ncbi:SEC-C motif-containing protein [Roseibium hamelinense]|uniref:SEC-C motif-containing protein n=2 Tax=Roseibium hamelinense TaxID=150831 RepID=A0A562SMC5_9HYPH|nr:zinc chelation protein SecC [Roseibium hamelinense]TWI81806.1 SEC-C motif-containing protein [Roseibium hamelinense]